MKNYLFLITMLLALNLSAQEKTAKPAPAPTKTETKVDATPQAPEAGLPEAAQAEAEQAAQDSTIIITPPPNGVPTVDWLFSQANVIYMILLYLLTFLSGYLPVLKKLDDKRLRALIIGLILAAGVVVWQLFEKSLDWKDFAGLVFAFVSTQLGYQFILSPIPILKTPNPKPAA